MPTAFIQVPPSYSVRVLAVGATAAVLLLPEGMAPPDTLTPGTVSGLISFDPGQTTLDRAGQCLAVGMLEIGAPVAFVFSRLADALRFQATTLRAVECAA